MTRQMAGFVTIEEISSPVATPCIWIAEESNVAEKMVLNIQHSKTAAEILPHIVWQITSHLKITENTFSFFRSATVYSLQSTVYSLQSLLYRNHSETVLYTKVRTYLQKRRFFTTPHSSTHPRNKLKRTHHSSLHQLNNPIKCLTVFCLLGLVFTINQI